MQDDGYVEPMDTTSQQGSAQSESSKLPPVLANLMGNLSGNSRSPVAPNAASSPVAPTVNVQELLSSIMVNSSRSWFLHTYCFDIRDHEVHVPFYFIMKSEFHQYVV